MGGVLMKIFVIADTHFDHKNIIDYCNRPFSSVQEMNKTLIKNWNETVSNKDIVVHLGDFAFGNKQSATEICKKLNGRKMLIKGNHDNWNDQVYRDMGFEYVSKFPIVYDGFYIMSHAPLPPISDKLPFMQIYGHVHNDEKYQDTANSKCVSVERIGYRPYLLYEKN